MLHLSGSGSGFALGAPITIGYYTPADPTTTKTVYTSTTGTFATDITVTTTGNLTYIAAGIGGNGNNRYLETATTAR